MQAACGSQSLKILVATNDRAQVRRLSQFLDMMRFDVLQAADAPSALVAIEAEQPALLLLGEDIAAARDWQFCRDLAEHPLGAGAFKFLIVNDPEASSLNEALEAGIAFQLQHSQRPHLITRPSAVSGTAPGIMACLAIPGCAALFGHKALDPEFKEPAPLLVFYWVAGFFQDFPPAKALGEEPALRDLRLALAVHL